MVGAGLDLAFQAIVIAFQFIIAIVVRLLNTHQAAKRDSYNG